MTTQIDRRDGVTPARSEIPAPFLGFSTPCSQENFRPPSAANSPPPDAANREEAPISVLHRAVSKRWAPFSATPATTAWRLPEYFMVI
jgi:hypothetical protein